MTLRRLKDRALNMFAGSIVAMIIIALVSGGRASVLILVTGVIGGLALQVFLLATVADATVQTLKKEK